MYARTRSCCGPLLPYVAQHYKIELSGSLFCLSLERNIQSRDAGMLLRSNPIKNQKKKRSFLFPPKKKSKMEIDIMNAHVIGANLFLSWWCVFKNYRISHETKHGRLSSRLCARYFLVFPVRSNLIICTCTIFPPFFANDISLSALTDGLSLLLLLLSDPTKKIFASSSPRMIVPIQWAMSIEGETDVYRERESQQQLKGSHYRADKEL